MGERRGTTGLAGQRVVVIGGSSGIGLSVAAQALSAGAEVVIGSSSADKVATAVSALGGSASGVVVDVHRESDIEAFFASVGVFDHLVYTAGDWGPNRGGGPIGQLDLTTADRVFAVRFWGAVAAIKHAVRQIRPTGSITLTDGMIAHRPRAGAALSSAMAGATEHLVRALAIELAPVRVNAVCPGYILTGVWDSFPPDQRAARLEALTARQPLPRAGLPDEVAAAYLYLMSGGFTTGQVLQVDGGMGIV